MPSGGNDEAIEGLMDSRLKRLNFEFLQGGASLLSSGRKRKKRDLNFWVLPNAGFSTRAVLQPLISEFERKWPDVQIRLTVHPWSLGWDRLMEVIKGRYLGPIPDVVQVGTTWVATLSYLGALEKIPSAKVLPGNDKMSAYIWDPGSQNEADENLFCVPWFIDVRVLYYRRDIFDAIKIRPEILHDWKGFYQACLEIQKYLRRSGPVSKIIAPLAIPGQKPGVLMHDLAPWVWGAGGTFCSDDLTQAKLSEEEAITGCDFYFDLINQGFMPIPDGHLPQGNFFTGHYAMQFSGSWPAETYLNPRWEHSVPEVANGFAVTLFPAGPQGRYTFLGGSNLGVTSMSPNKDLAWEFIQFLTDPSRQLAHAQAIGSLTARLTSMEQLFERYPTVKKTFWDSFGQARRLPRLIPLGSVEQIVYKMGARLLSSIRKGDYNPHVLMTEIKMANDDMNAVLSLHRYGTENVEKAS